MDLVPVRKNKKGEVKGYRVERYDRDDIVDIPSDLPLEVGKGRYDPEKRANAFTKVTWNVSLVTGFGMMCAAFALENALSFAIVTMYFFGGFCLVWLLSFVLYTFVSAEGVDLLQVLFVWRFLGKEQKERWDYYKSSRLERPE